MTRLSLRFCGLYYSLASTSNTNQYRRTIWFKPIRPLLLTLIASLSTASLAQETELLLQCIGSIETFGSKFPRSTKQDNFDLKVNTISGAIGGGFAELITNTDSFTPRVTETEISATAFGDRKSTRLNSSHRNTSRMPSSA